MVALATVLGTQPLSIPRDNMHSYSVNSSKVKWRPCVMFSLGLILGILSCMAQARTSQSINDQWLFSLGAISQQQLPSANLAWQAVNLPHTWNQSDTFDEQPGYHRGRGWYQKTLGLHPQGGKHYLLRFEGVNQVAEVYINGHLAGEHQGGYTAFVVDITEYLQPQDNVLQVSVDNSHDPDIVPLKGDFNFYGGIYRDVWLIELQDVHFDAQTYASSGVYVTTADVSAEQASVEIKSLLVNAAHPRVVEVRHTLQNPDGTVVNTIQQRVTLNSGRNEIPLSKMQVASPQLWHPDAPNLYTLVSEIRYVDDAQLLDSITTSIGLRWFRFDPQQGFFLNGQALKLMGVNRHQDMAGLGNALSDERHNADMQLVKQSGSNFLRTAHYPQDSAVLEAADQLGLLVSMEIPLDHDITDSPAFYQNTLTMHKEMIHQNFNHPSIIIWAYMNEMLLRRSWQTDAEIIPKITAFAKVMEKLTRELDPGRYTMIPNHGDFALYQRAGLTEIPMLVGWNLYYGWYEADMAGLGHFLDHAHQMLPTKPMLVTEYGAGADPRIRSFDPQRFDFSIEWQTQFLHNNLQQILARPFVAGAAVWNLFDFGSRDRRDAVPFINSKGLMSFDRQPKDSYHLLQAWLSTAPLLRIAARGWHQRAGQADSQKRNQASQWVEVYGNTSQAELWHNGKSLGVKPLTSHIARWQVPFTAGQNILRAKAQHGQRVIEDVSSIDFTLYAPGEFQALYLNIGAHYSFTDKDSGVLWLADEQYRDGYWGLLPSKGSKSKITKLDVDISQTSSEPLFQRARQGQFSYQFDLPPGQYELSLLLTRLTADNVHVKPLPEMSISANGQLLTTEIPRSLSKAPFALKQKFVLNVTQQNLIVDFSLGDQGVALGGIGLRKTR